MVLQRCPHGNRSWRGSFCACQPEEVRAISKARSGAKSEVTSGRLSDTVVCRM